MHLYDLNALLPGVPWLSLIWISMLLPAITMMLLKPEQKYAIRVVGTSFAFISLALSLLVFFGYDYTSGQKLQFVEEVPWLPQIGINYILGVDGISLPMLILNGFVIFPGALMSWNIEDRAREYWVLLLILTSGVYGVFVSVDLFLFFIFYELAVLPMYLLIGIWGSTRKEYGAMKLTLYLMGGSAMVIIGMVALYFGSGLHTFDMRQLAQVALLPRAFQIAFFPPTFLGFAVLAGMFPFHTWSPTGHVAAPTAVSMLHAGVLMKLGAYGCLRVAIWLLPQGARDEAWIFLICGTVAAVYGAFSAMAQRDLKFVVGYSSVSHMGYVIVGICTLSLMGLSGAVLQMFSHEIMTALFFALVGSIYDQAHTREIGIFGGLARTMPWFVGFFSVAGLASLGLPGLSGFVAELMIFLGAFQTYPVV